MSQFAKGYAIAMVGVALWSTTGVFVGYLLTTHTMPPLLLAMWRDLLVCVALFPALALLRRSWLALGRDHIRFFVLYGLILALFNSIWVVSVQANGAAVATVLAYSSAGFTVLLARWLFGESLGPVKGVAVALSLSGCVLVADAYRPAQWALNPVGVSTGLLSGLFFAGYSLMGKEAARRGVNPWTSLLVSFACGSFFIMLFNLVPGVARGSELVRILVPDLPPVGWLALVVLSCVPTLLGYGLYMVSLTYLPAGVANLLTTAEPAMTAVLAYIFLGERMTAVQIVGTLIILSAVVIVRRAREEAAPYPSRAVAG
jgi:drug/metabolite transporter (DMT)-like permease